VQGAFISDSEVERVVTFVKEHNGRPVYDEAFTNDIELEAAKAAGAPVDPYQAQLDAEAMQLARVLYGVRQNSTDDLRTLCWCVFNRVDSPDYADTLAEVIEQPKQWMRYSPDNPVLDDLFQIARAELEAWHNGPTRPCGTDYVFMTWSPTEIVLRNTWTNSSQTRYWRVKQ
jgi:DNA segregation ATPase FtsK/SpoIIIE-like protein